MWNLGVIVVLLITVTLSASENFHNFVPDHSFVLFPWSQFEDIDYYSEYNYAELDDEDYEEDSKTDSWQSIFKELPQHNDTIATSSTIINMENNGITTEMYTTTGTDMYTMNGTDMYSDIIITEIYSDIRTEMNSKTTTDMYNDITTEMYNSISPTMDNDISTQIDNNFSTEMYITTVPEMYITTVPEMYNNSTEIYNDVSTQTDNNIGTEKHNDIGTDMYNSSSTEMYNETSTEYNVQFNTKTTLKIYNTGTESSKNIAITEKYKEFINVTKMYNNTRTDIYNAIGSNIQNETVTKSYNNISAEIYNDIGTKIHNATATMMFNNSSTETYNDIGTKTYNNTTAATNNDIDKRRYNKTSINTTIHSGTSLNSAIAVELPERSIFGFGFFYRLRGRKKDIITERLCPENRTCARKCCSSGKAYDPLKNECVNLTHGTFSPTLWQDYKWLPAREYAADVLTFLNASIICPPSSSEVRIPVTEISQVFRLSVDGNLYVEISRTVTPEWLKFKTNKYCLDLFVAEDNTTELNALICHRLENIDVSMHYYLSGICMLITCFLVLLRVLIFAWVPELQTLHGRILIAYLVNFFVGFLLLAIEQFLTIGNFISGNKCFILTLTVYFSTLSAYFWRNVMCYDIWWTFSGKRAISGRGPSSRARFRIYCAYAFGGPMALTVILALLELYNLPNYYPLLPRIRDNCFLFGYGRLLYFLGPIMLLFIMNMIFFTRTALKIAAIKKQNKLILRTKDSCTQKQNTRRFSLYVKLFGSMAFMEFNLVLEILTILSGNTVNIMYISDAFNVLAPFIIIVNFLCKRQTWKMIRRRLGRNGYLQKKNNPLTRNLLTTLEPSQEKSGFDQRKTVGFAKEESAACQYWDDV